MAAHDAKYTSSQDNSDDAYASVPQELQEGEQFVTWRYEERNGKLTKPPFDPKTDHRASSINPKTWGTIKQAITASQHYPNIAGIGRVLTADDPYFGIDLDDCYD